MELQWISMLAGAAALAVPLSAQAQEPLVCPRPPFVLKDDTTPVSPTPPPQVPVPGRDPGINIAQVVVPLPPAPSASAPGTPAQAQRVELSYTLGDTRPFIPEADRARFRASSLRVHVFITSDRSRKTAALLDRTYSLPVAPGSKPSVKARILETVPPSDPQLAAHWRLMQVDVRGIRKAPDRPPVALTYRSDCFIPVATAQPR